MLALDDVHAAAGRLGGVANRTPVITSRTLDARVGVPVVLKVESMQRTGSFKFRGAYNAVAQLSAEQRARGVATASSGNHGQAVALAARLCGTTAVVVMPHDAPQVKVDAVTAYGARIVRYHRFDEQRDSVMESVAAKEQRVLIAPYDNHDVMAGQGTAALELVDDRPDCTTIVVPLGGGGLLAGTSTVAAALNVAAVGVEPVAGNDHVLSAEAGHRVRLPSVPTTIADGQQVQMPGALTWPVNQHNGASFVAVEDDEIARAMRFAFTTLKLVLEPSGACALAGLLAGAIVPTGPTGVILTGGNVDPRRFAALLGATS